MQTTKIVRPRGLFAVLGILVSVVGLSLAGCAQTQSRGAATTAKPGNNAPHEERNPSQHPEQFSTR